MHLEKVVEGLQSQQTPLPDPGTLQLVADAEQHSAGSHRECCALLHQ